MANNKIIFGDQVLIDLTGDTVTTATLAKGVTAHDKSGAVIVGVSTKDVDSTDATAAVGEILLNKTAYARGTKLTGTMPNNGGVTGTITTKTGQYTIPQGYHDGSGKVSISSTAVAGLVSTNIRSGVTILGITGDMEEDTENPETGKEVTPTKEDQVITPAEGNTCFRQITVKAIPYSETPNSAGGTTITIG